MWFSSAWKTLLPSLLVAVAVSSLAAEPPPIKPDSNAAKAVAAPTGKERPKTKAPAKPRVRVTISKETTYITEPLRKDGYPDYVAALNQRLSKGVTPENNAAVPFWKAMGPKGITKDHRERYFQMLGISPLPEKGDYFVTSSDWIDRHETKDDSKLGLPGENQANALQDQIQVAMKCAWSKEEFPVWAEWLETNEKPMALLVEACQRSRRYEPLISGDSHYQMLMVAQLPGAQQSRDLARALTMRAMFRVGEGKIDDAWSDLLNCHRLARSTDEGAFLVDGLVALTIENIAQNGDRAVLQHGKLTTVQIAKMLADLDKLPRMKKVADRLDLAERFMLLDCASIVAREGLSGLSDLSSFGGGGTSKSMTKSLVDSLASSSIDWDIPHRMVNSWYDRLVASVRKPTLAERVMALNKLDKNLREMYKSIWDPEPLGWALLGNPRTAISERMGRLLVGLLLPACSAAQTAEDRMAMQSEMHKLAFTLAAYRIDHGSYPAKLDELVPKHVKQLPKDIFNNDGDLHYARDDDGYLLYSLGANGKDDGGKGQDDRKNNEDWDDLTVRMSASAH